MAELSWGLVIATKDRPDPLAVCVALALAQTRPPVEVVVADSSAAWQDHARRIGALLEDRPEIRLVYEQGAAPSLTVQRNQAVALARADVVFMIDDDSFMHPTCAEEIMRIYEADSDGLVAGVEAAESPDNPQPGRNDHAGARKEAQTVDVSRARAASPLLAWVFRVLFMMGKKEVFVPYDKVFHEAPLPERLHGLDAAPVALFGGFRMTYRRRAVLESPFDATLRYYCPGEDLDGSYRISRQGLLLDAHRAKLHHYVSASGRLDRRQVAHLWSLNQAVLLRRHAPDQRWARAAYNRKMLHRVMFDLLKDLLTRRLSFPQTRGSWAAWREARAVFGMTPDALEHWYPGRQAQIVGGGKAQPGG